MNRTMISALVTGLLLSASALAAENGARVLLVADDGHHGHGQNNEGGRGNGGGNPAPQQSGTARGNPAPTGGGAQLQEYRRGGNWFNQEPGNSNQGQDQHRRSGNWLDRGQGSGSSNQVQDQHWRGGNWFNQDQGSGKSNQSQDQRRHGGSWFNQGSGTQTWTQDQRDQRWTGGNSRDQFRHDQHGFGDRQNNWNGRTRNFDWHDYAHNEWARHRFHDGDYRRPDGWYYRRWSYGEYLPAVFWDQDYWLTDWSDFDLPTPPYGYEWVRYGDDALLVNIYTGQILEVEYGVFY